MYFNTALLLLLLLNTCSASLLVLLREACGRPSLTRGKLFIQNNRLVKQKKWDKKSSFVAHEHHHTLIPLYDMVTHVGKDMFARIRHAPPRGWTRCIPVLCHPLMPIPFDIERPYMVCVGRGVLSRSAII